MGIVLGWLRVESHRRKRRSLTLSWDSEAPGRRCLVKVDPSHFLVFDPVEGQTAEGVIAGPFFSHL